MVPLARSEDVISSASDADIDEMKTSYLRETGLIIALSRVFLVANQRGHSPKVDTPSAHEFLLTSLLEV